MMRKIQEDRDRRSENQVLCDSKDENELVREQRTRSTPVATGVENRWLCYLAHVFGHVMHQFLDADLHPHSLLSSDTL
jgi:hypothetical protein